MGKKIVLTGTTLTDMAAPKLFKVDPIESAGSLYLWDATHPAGIAVVGVPANGLVTGNVLAAFTDALVGAPTNGLFVRGVGFDATKGRIDRSTKGGLHGVVSPTLGDSTTAFTIEPNTALTQYIVSNPTHTYYGSIWGRITKVATSGAGIQPGQRMELTRSPSPAANYHILLSNTQGTRTAASAGNAILSSSKGAWTGVAPASTSEARFKFAVLPGASQMNTTTTAIRAQGGFILYRVYLENLTVSGRTYAEVDAIDLSLYTKEVLTAGGRYFGDTFTDPTTLV